eukprot:TRINITY_DN5118_c0_g1::TRINITY_DN5118_c0_g1_i1::g.29413::m.29413 TRINITY_DN5118_c0_g1::TRINITY_DN5118_c0_g1_i1::g.29413  ORF type:complete len:144 (-),score=50.83,sp/P32495/NHP2_YEAST/56.83/1e-44,Ribosomal_L7Ae/PF01248.21/1.7e-26 TRINITY_DN5118_c0_g1_i1:372-803(-)
MSDVETPSKEKKSVPLFVSPIASPMAGKKLSKKVLKLAKKASKAKKVRRGVREVVKAIRKGEKGICVLAGDIAPVDVISHIPVLCEENKIPYVFIPSKEELGAACQSTRPTSTLLVQAKLSDDLKESYAEVFAEVEKVLPDYS